jgi:predicted amidohydrolase YtcJ
MRPPNLLLLIALVAVPAPLRAYTVGQCLGGQRGGDQGPDTPGKLADLVVLDRDPFAVEPDELKDLEVRRTIVGGEVVWKDGEYRVPAVAPLPVEGH